MIRTPLVINSGQVEQLRSPDHINALHLNPQVLSSQLVIPDYHNSLLISPQISGHLIVGKGSRLLIL